MGISPWPVVHVRKGDEMSESEKELFSSMLGASEAETVKILIDLIALISSGKPVGLDDVQTQLSRTCDDIETRQGGIPTAKYKALLKYIDAMKQAETAALS